MAKVAVGHDSLVGQTLAHYRILERIGEGGMGVVYRARDQNLGRDVALKVLPEQLASDTERLHRLELEARATAALNHPNILAIHEMARQRDVLFLVEELLEGESLRDRLRNGPLALRKTIDYSIQIANGLAAAHDKGIVHRDLKPENLFITADDRVKILDFGLARLRQSPDSTGETETVSYATDPGVVLGTVGYMSPEQVRGQQADHRSDIFAFGAVLYEMVTGRHAFRKPTPAETMTAILNEEIPTISQTAPGCPPELERVLARCLEKKPERRFQSASDMAFALEALSNASSSTAAQLQVLSRPFWSVGRMAIVAFAAVALILAAAVAYWSTRSAPVPRLTNFVQMTHDGQQKRIIGTDGSRIYLYLESPENSAIAEMSMSGGEIRKISLPSVPDLYPVSLSPDGAEFIGRRNWSIGISSGVTSPLWSVPVMGGTPRQLGAANGTMAELSPDGKHLVYTNAKALYLSNADGTEAHELVPGVIAYHLAWSPDGARIRFERYEVLNGRPLLWEVSVDGSGLHRLIPDWTKPPEVERCGRWLPNGKYFLFQTRQHIWALPEERRLFGSAPKPIQLTSGPMRLSTPFASADGKKLYAVGTIQRGELTRYDMKSQKFVSFLGGISIEHLDYSPDGQWVAYITYPERVLWRSRADGSERLQLTFQSREPVEPHWSPDGKQIVYTDSWGEKQMKAFIVSAQGGIPRQLLPHDTEGEDDADWTPDGKKIIMTRASSVQVVDIATGEVTTLPGSKDMGWPRFSPNGKFIAATSNDRDLAIFDMDTQKWSLLGKFESFLCWPSWTPDGNQVQLLDFNLKGSSIIRVNIHTGAIERIKLGSFEETGIYPIGWLGIAPDDSPLLLRNAGTSDVYSADWEER